MDKDEDGNVGFDGDECLDDANLDETHPMKKSLTVGVNQVDTKNTLLPAFFFDDENQQSKK